MSDLQLEPITFREASAFVEEFHRHHKKPNGWRFGVGVSSRGVMVGVIMVSHPIARHLNDG